MCRLIALVMFSVMSLSLLNLSADDKDGFTALFNGKDLSGWSVVTKDAKADGKATWTVADGILKCSGKPTGYLVTDKVYANYMLRLKWKYAPTALKRPSSGVLIHAQKPDVFWPHSYEAQLASGEAGDIWFQYDVQKQLPKLTIDPTRKNEANKEGRQYFRIGKGEKIEKPIGEWNQCEITCKGGDITIHVNGKLVNEGKDGSLTQGRIGLQAEGAEIHFKDIEFKPTELRR